MSKELPYFKFMPVEWQGGRITYQPLEIQGAFLQACCTYWKQLGDMTIEDYSYRMTPEIAQKLIDLKFIEVSNGVLSISFLDEQLSQFKELSKIKSDAAAKRWNANAMHVHKSAMQSDANKEEEKEVEEEKENIYTQFKELFIAITGKKIKGINQKVKQQISARIKEGYALKDFETAIKNCKADDFHIQHKLKYLTTEFITRADKLEKYALANNIPQGRLTIEQRERGV